MLNIKNICYEGGYAMNGISSINLQSIEDDTIYINSLGNDNISNMLKNVNTNHKDYLIVQNNTPLAAVVTVDEYNRLKGNCYGSDCDKYLYELESELESKL